MPLYRSARLFTLGLALAGTCAAQDPQDNKATHKPAKQQQRADRAVRKPLNAKAPKKTDRAQA
jgi:hypothetical protein